MPEIEIGKVTHLFQRISVAIITVTTGELVVGDTIHIKGHTSDFTTKVEGMQIEHVAVQTAKPGDQVGVKVPILAHENDKVFKVVP